MRSDVVSPANDQAESPARHAPPLPVLVRTPPLPRISVIIPVLNEEARIRRTLAEVSDLAGVDETIIVDGGSEDGTVERARQFSRSRVLSSPRGRAAQMNAGAAVASGEVLVFLHADVSLPDDAAHWIREVLADPAVVAGAFRTCTVSDAGRSWLEPLLRLADLRSRYSSLPYGDQAIFVRAEVFRRAGGFPEQPLLEDLELSRRIRRMGRIRIVPATVRVSGRRFLARPIYYAILVNLLPLLYRLGMPPGALSGVYDDPR